jgi:hypothetical protein
VKHELTAVFVLCSAAIGCKTADPPAVCIDPISIDPSRREVRTEEWMTLLLRGQDRTCTGDKIEPEPLPEKCGALDAEGALLPLEELGDDDVIVNRVDKTRRLVWLITRRFANGEGVGPVALVELGKEGMAVMAIGTLKAMPAGAKLRLHPLGEGRKAGEVVTAEGGRCDKDGEEQCERTLVLLARRSTALTTEHLESERGVCIGQAKINLSKRKRTALDNGWQREFELLASPSYVREGIVVHELVTVRDFDPKNREATIKEVRRAEGDRMLRWVDGLLVVSDVPLWERMTQ